MTWIQGDSTIQMYQNTLSDNTYNSQMNTVSMVAASVALQYDLSDQELVELRNMMMGAIPINAAFVVDIITIRNTIVTAVYQILKKRNAQV